MYLFLTCVTPIVHAIFFIFRINCTKVQIWQTKKLPAKRSEPELRKARNSIAQMFAAQGDETARNCRIALVGLRGAGKSTLGRRLAGNLSYPFIELSRKIEKYAGCNISEIHSLYGANAYRRYEKRGVMRNKTVIKVACKLGKPRIN